MPDSRTIRCLLPVLALALSGCGHFSYCVNDKCIEQSEETASEVEWEIAKRHHKVKNQYKVLPERHPATRWVHRRLKLLLPAARRLETYEPPNDPRSPKPAAGSRARLLRDEMALLARQTVVAHGDLRYVRPGSLEVTLHLIEDEAPIAFTEIGGNLYLSTGLLVRRINSCRELTAVLAHELGHMLLKHPARLYPDRHDEFVADRAAVLLLHLSGLPANGLADFLSRVSKAEEVTPCPDAFFGAHPPSFRRIDAIVAAAKKMRARYPDVASPIDCEGSDEQSYDQLQASLKYQGGESRRDR